MTFFTIISFYAAFIVLYFSNTFAFVPVQFLISLLKHEVHAFITMQHLLFSVNDVT
jgi:hypothetical protein